MFWQVVVVRRNNHFGLPLTLVIPRSPPLRSCRWVCFSAFPRLLDTMFHFLKLFLSISYIFLISWAPEALGPLPNCRSHFSDLDGIDESFWILQNSSFMTKQCSKTFHEVFLKYFLFFIISWALEALGPLPNCRSHFSDLDGIDESFWTLQNSAFMTKQCSKAFHEVFLKYFLFFFYYFLSPGGSGTTPKL